MAEDPHVSGQSQEPGHSILLFGEVLWDVLPGERSVLGGAPLNVAWHLRGLGKSPRVISRVGHDARGRWILRRMQDWGLEIGGIQMDSRRRTGTAQVSLTSDGPEFLIPQEQAWDFISSSQLPDITEHSESVLLYGGTLALRSDDSHTAFNRLTQNGNTRLFLDLNLRPPWNNSDLIREQLQRARWLKLNEAELRSVTGADPDDPKAIRAALQVLFEEHSLELIFVTRGKKGALLVRGNEVLEKRPQAIDDTDGDSVGAGDAFSAVTLMGLLEGWDYETLLERAVRFATQVCTFSGALTDEIKFYTSFRDEWGLTE